MKKRYTTEELLKIEKQPQDSCPFLNNIIQDIHQMIKNPNTNKIKSIKSNLDSANNVIDSIYSWSSSLEEIYNKHESLDENKDFYNCSIIFKNKAEEFNRSELSTKLLNSINDDLIPVIDSTYLNNSIFEYSQKEKDENKSLLEFKRDNIFSIIEDIRNIAINRRSFGNNIKKAYKDISIMNDFYDIYQPIEYLKEHNNNKSIYNIGIKNSEVSFQQLVSDNLINDTEAFLISKLDTKSQDIRINEILKENDYKGIAFFNSLDEFIDNKTYTIKNIENNKLKNKYK